MGRFRSRILRRPSRTATSTAWRRRQTPRPLGLSHRSHLGHICRIARHGRHGFETSPKRAPDAPDAPARRYPAKTPKRTLLKSNQKSNSDASLISLSFDLFLNSLLIILSYFYVCVLHFSFFSCTFQSIGSTWVDQADISRLPDTLTWTVRLRRRELTQHDAMQAAGAKQARLKEFAVWPLRS